MTDNYIWGFGALTFLVLLAYSLAIFGGVKSPHKATHKK
jgi:hypothetical protein